MLFKYIGDKKEMKDVYGYNFSGNAIVDIPDSDTRTIRKLGANSHFRRIETLAPAAPVEPEAPVAVKAPRPKKSDKEAK